MDDEQVKPYLKLDNVINGVFMLAEKLYGLKFVPNNEIAVYHPDVTAYEVYDAADGKNELLSILYLDFFPRESKRSGAWMTEFRGTKVIEGVETRPLVSLVMNFTKPTETTPSLLTFDEFTTFLHEFGHALHGMLAKGEYESMNGTNVYRDFVELPSQILENWAVEKEYLDMWAVHYKTGEPILSLTPVTCPMFFYRNEHRDYFVRETSEDCIYFRIRNIGTTAACSEHPVHPLLVAK